MTPKELYDEVYRDALAAGMDEDLARELATRVAEWDPEAAREAIADAVEIAALCKVCKAEPVVARRFVALGYDLPKARATLRTHYHGGTLPQLAVALASQQVWKGRKP